MSVKLKIAIGFVALLFALSLFKDALAQNIVSASLSQILHVPVHIGSVKIKVLLTEVTFKNLQVYNPAEFSEKLMLDMPLVAADFESGDLLKGQVHFETMELDLKELTVIKNRQGVLNIDVLKPSKHDEKAATTQKKKPFVLRIDKLTLTVGKVVYKDYSGGGEPRVQSFDIRINKRVYFHIDNPIALVSLIMKETLTRTALAKIVSLDVFQEGARTVLSEGGDILGKGLDVGAETVENTAKGILGLFK